LYLLLLRFLMWVGVGLGGPGSVVGLETGYGLDSPGIESRWGGGGFSALVPDRPWGTPSLPYNGYWVFSWGKEWPGCDDPSPHGQERVELYVCSAYGPYSLYRASLPVQRCALPSPFLWGKTVTKSTAVVMLCNL
jgi:hypothetical protein